MNIHQTLWGIKIVQRPKSKEIKINNMSSVYISTIPYNIIIIPYLSFSKINFKNALDNVKLDPPPSMLPHPTPYSDQDLDRFESTLLEVI